jgi:hypothetical protein
VICDSPLQNRWWNDSSPQYSGRIGKRSQANLDMFPRTQVIRDHHASQCDTKKILTAFARRITAHEGTIQTLTSNGPYRTALNRDWISSSIYRLTKDCFVKCKSFTSVTFESNSKLHRIEESAFAQSGWRTIQIPASVEVLCKSCFSNCSSLTSVPFQPNSKLHRIEASVFTGTVVTDLLLPNSIHFLSGSAIAVSSLNTVSFWPG